MQAANLYEARVWTDVGKTPRTVAGADVTALDGAFARWMELDGPARLLVDDDLFAVWMSPAAAVAIGETPSLLIRDGRLRSHGNRYERQLRTLVRQNSSGLTIQCIYDVATGERLVMTARRLNGLVRPLIGLTLRRASDFEFDLADLRAAFGFTQAEARVARRLLCGLTAEETAQDLEVSLETVRTHIKRAYAKLGVSSREAFFHRLTPYMVVLA